MRFHRYDTISGCYLGWVDGEATTYAGRPGYTSIAPPVCPPGMAPVMTGEGAWQMALDLRGRIYHDPATGAQMQIATAGQTPQDGWVEGLPPVVGPTLAALRLAAEQRIDAAAGQARLRYLTDAPGQDATYTTKYAEALAYIAAGYPADLSGYPYIAAEATPNSPLTPTQAATRIAVLGGYWRDVKGPQIEGARICGKDALAACGSAAEIDTHANSVITAMEAL